MKIELNDQTKQILGMICLQCGPIAHLLAKGGWTIKTRAEDEQAAVIHWLLNLYLEHGDNWREIAQAELNRISAKVISELEMASKESKKGGGE